RARWMRLDGYAGKFKSPRPPQLLLDHLGRIAAARRAEEASVGFEPVWRGREAECRDLRGDHAVLGRAAGVKRLRHRSEVFPEAAGLGSADADGAPHRIAIEPEEPTGGRRGTNRAARRRAVEAMLIVARHDRFGDLALDLHADLVREHHVRTAASV